MKDFKMEKKLLLWLMYSLFFSLVIQGKIWYLPKSWLNQLKSTTSAK